MTGMWLMICDVCRRSMAEDGTPQPWRPGGMWKALPKTELIEFAAQHGWIMHEGQECECGNTHFPDEHLCRDCSEGKCHVPR